MLYWETLEISFFSIASDDAEEFKNEFVKYPTEKITSFPLGKVMIKRFQNGSNIDPEIVDFRPITFKKYFGKTYKKNNRIFKNKVW